MVTFLHTADWQLGKPFSGVGDAGKRARIRQERFDALRRVRDVAREKRVAFVLVAGDLFDSPTPSKTLVAQALGLIGEIPVPVYVIPGNHDHGGLGSLWEQPFFVSEQRRHAPGLRPLLERRPVDVGDAVILPCPLLRRHDTGDPSAWVHDLDAAALGDKPRIVLAHGSTATFGQAPDGEDVAGPANVIDADRLQGPDVDYVALGDWHGFLEVGPKAWYSGTHETDRFPRPGQRPGHVACVTATRGGAPAVEAVATGRLGWHAVSIDAGDDAPARCETELAAVTHGAGFDACLVALTLSGRLSLGARRELDRVIESWSHRLLDLGLDDRTTTVPSAEEIRGLVERAGDPIVAGVAAELVRIMEGDPAAADDARTAIDILHGLCRTAGEAGR